MAEPLRVTEPTNPGSLNEFSTRLGIDPGAEGSVAKYSDALQELRDQLAAEKGVDVESLHSLGHQAIDSSER